MAAGVACSITLFRELSGGFANPAVAFATIIWSEFSLNVDLDADNSPWSYTYATSFVVGPFAGSVLAGVFFNILDYYGNLINTDDDLDRSFFDDSQSSTTRTPQSISGNNSIVGTNTGAGKPVQISGGGQTHQSRRR